MFFPESNIKIWLCTLPTDMRKSFTGLMAIAKNQLNENPLNGELFVFINRRQTQIKILYFDRSGYCIWMKKLEEGRFQYPINNANKALLDRTQLTLILEGIDLNKIHQNKRYNHAEKIEKTHNLP